MPVLKLLALPYCRVAMFSPWNAPRHRWFAAYHRRGGYRWLLGHATIDEFATLSSPVFLTSPALLGQLYNAGLSLVHRRDKKLDLDFGWPPLCAGVSTGLEEGQAEPSGDWEQRLFERLAAAWDEGAGSAVSSRRVAGYELSRADVGEVTLWATEAPLLPKQLRRLAATAPGALGIAVATGNRIAPSAGAGPLALRAVSESRLNEILTAARTGSEPG